jgi:hypothetical protein
VISAWLVLARGGRTGWEHIDTINPMRLDDPGDGHEAIKVALELHGDSLRDRADLMLDGELELIAVREPERVTVRTKGTGWAFGGSNWTANRTTAPKTSNSRSGGEA